MKTLIFDFDGTIADSFELAYEIASGLTDAAQVDESELERLRHMSLRKVVAELKVPLHRLPLLIFRGRQLMHERIHEVHPFPGMPEVLEALHADPENHLLVISSNSEQNVRTFLRANNLESYFDGVYGSAAVFNKASALRRVIRRNRIDKSTCYYIGDEVRDIVAATKVGIEPVSVIWGYQAPEALAEHHPLALVKDPPHLLEVFGSDRV
jgi:phosphoglycolate phosphatase-like HAD superfamily hydrolase